MHITPPFPDSKITQRFGDNANPLYKGQGLKGHTAYDYGVPYGTPIPNCVANAYCYSRMHEGDKNLMDYKAIFFLFEDETGVYEISYGHLSGFVAEVGKTYQVGDIVGYVGNSGACYVGQHLVTETEKEAGSHAGAHLHGPQVRVLKKVKKLTGAERIYDQNGLLKKDGFYFEVPDYDNGYNSCVDPSRFFDTKLPSNTSVPFAVALAILRKSLTGADLTRAEAVLRNKYGQ